MKPAWGNVNTWTRSKLRVVQHHDVASAVRVEGRKSKMEAKHGGRVAGRGRQDRPLCKCCARGERPGVAGRNGQGRPRCGSLGEMKTAGRRRGSRLAVWGSQGRPHCWRCARSIQGRHQYGRFKRGARAGVAGRGKLGPNRGPKQSKLAPVTEPCGNKLAGAVRLALVRAL